MRASDIRLCEIEPIFSEATLRTPLKFGSGVVSAITDMRCRVLVETRGGQRAEGWGNILLSDLWAFPSASVPHETRDLAMRQLAERFCRFMLEETRWGHPFEIFLEAKEALAALAAEISTALALAEPLPILAALVCASPVDAALTDAFGRALGLSSYEVYGPEFMHYDLATWLGPSFRGRYPADYLHKTFKPRLPIFHLVGGMDKLTRAEITDEDPQDGLPVSLEEWIERDGLRCFKVKLRGEDIAWDVDRTAEVAAVIRATYERLGWERPFYLSVDSNELNPDPESVVEYLERLQERSPMAYAALLYLEQPVERDLTVHCFDMSSVAERKPVVVDEGVTDVESLRQAIALGWSGVALKTCKGHSASLLYLALAREDGLVVTFQDLTNPGLALVHEAGFAARIDTLMGFEYNARQFLPFAQPEVQARHPSLFRVVDGYVSTETLRPVGLGD